MDITLEILLHDYMKSQINWKILMLRFITSISYIFVRLSTVLKYQEQQFNRATMRLYPQNLAVLKIVLKSVWEAFYCAGHRIIKILIHLVSLAVLQAQNWPNWDERNLCKTCKIFLFYFGKHITILPPSTFVLWCMTTVISYSEVKNPKLWSDRFKCHRPN